MASYRSYSDARASNAFIDLFTRAEQVKFVERTPSPNETLHEDDFHLIDAEAKRAIFYRHLLSQAAQTQEGHDILERLWLLSPLAAYHFRVKENSVEKMTLRLWAQRETPGKREDSYIALSYCWDMERYPRQSDALYTLPISRLMFAALAGQRQWRTTGVWIDQLCIDQANKEEKAISIAAMDAVYRCAFVVVVALADVQVSLGEQALLRDYIRDYHSYALEAPTPHYGENPPYFEKEPLFRCFLGNILQSRWFTRAWCAHEMEIGEKLVFYVPCQNRNPQEPSNKLLAFSSIFLADMLKLSCEVPNGLGCSRDLADRLGKVLCLPNMLLRLQEQFSSKPGDLATASTHVQPYTAQIRDIFGLGAGGDPELPSNLREASACLDKTSIVLNTLGNGLAVKPGFHSDSTEEQHMQYLMLLGLAARDATVLCTLGPHFSISASHGLSSWLSKPIYEDLGSGHHRHDHLPKMPEALLEPIRIDPSPVPCWIELDVYALPPGAPPGEKYQRIATQLVQKGIELGMGRPPPGPVGDFGAEYLGKPDLNGRAMLMFLEGMNEWGNGPLYQFWHHEIHWGWRRNRFSLILACLLQCGMQWTLRTMKRSGYPDPLRLGDKFGAYFTDDTFEGIENLAWAELETGMEALGALFSAVMFVAEWGVNRPYGIATDHLPLLFDHGSGSKAMVFSVRDALTQEVIPVPLIADDYSRLYRVWLLQMQNDPWYENIMQHGGLPTWFMRCKAMLFTDVDAKDLVFSEGSAGDGQPGWRLRRGVTVHGPPVDFQRDETAHES